MSEVIIVGKGGGATHVARASGTLASLSNNMSAILVVAAGGGGSAVRKVDNIAKGGSGGGYIGGSPYYNNIEVSGKGGTQNSGYAFGEGREVKELCAGGGGGLYGGDGAISGVKAAFIEKISVSKGGTDRIHFTEEVTVSKVT